MAFPSYPRSFKGYLVDTNALSVVADILEHHQPPVFITHIQQDEVDNWPNTAQRERLKSRLSVVPRTPTADAVFDVSAWDECCWGDDDGEYEKVRKAIEALDIETNKGSSAFNLDRDALIIRTAIVCGFHLVTRDENMSKVANQWRIQVVGARTFRNWYGS